MAGGARSHRWQRFPCSFPSAAEVALTPVVGGVGVHPVSVAEVDVPVGTGRTLGVPGRRCDAVGSRRGRIGSARCRSRLLAAAEHAGELGGGYQLSAACTNLSPSRQRRRAWQEGGTGPSGQAGTWRRARPPSIRHFPWSSAPQPLPPSGAHALVM